MNKHLILSFLSLTFLFYFSSVQAQNKNPFSVKMKKAAPVGVSGSKALKGGAEPIKIHGKQVPMAPRATHIKSMPFSPGQIAPTASESQSLLKVQKDPATGNPIFLRRIETQQNRAPIALTTDTQIETAAVNFLDEVKTAINIKKPQEEFQVKAISRSNNGLTHVKFQQMYEGIPVYASEAIVHFTADQQPFMNGRFHPTPNIKGTTPIFSALDAIEIAKEDISHHTTVVELTTAQKEILGYENGPETELVIYKKPTYVSSHKLTWHITLRPNFVHRHEYFIDASTGEVLYSYDHTCTVGPAIGTSNDLNGVSQSFGIFELNTAGSYVMIDASKSMYTGPTNNEPANGDGVIYTGNFNNTTISNPTVIDIVSADQTLWNSTAVSAHVNAGISYDYYENTFSRSSIDGTGGDIVSFVNVADDDGSGLDNAFWNGAAMFYGNGNTAFDPLAGSLDVAGHEMTHGVIQATANLEYQGQSGALNESLADIFGVMIDRDDYQLGEDVIPNTNVFPTGFLRDMSNPHNGYAPGSNPLTSPGYQPEHMSELYTGAEDNGGVHINSGIPNRAFYLFAETIGIGKTIAEDVFYEAMTDYLTRSSQFVDLRLAVLQVATTTYSTNPTVEAAAKAAFDQVGILDGSGGGTGGSNYQVELPVNPGDAYLTLADLYRLDSEELYIYDVTDSTYTILSETEAKGGLSIMDDGTFGYFVSKDGHIREVDLTSGAVQPGIILSGAAEWDNVAISKDGKRIAAVSIYIDTAIYVFDYSTGAPNPPGVEYTLYNPTTAQGVNTGEVWYADAISFDYTGEYLIYDAFNVIPNSDPTEEDIDYFDVGFIKVWDNATDDFGDGTITKLFAGLEDGESVGNAVFSQNSPSVIAFDYFNSNTGDLQVWAGNIETGDIGFPFSSNRVLGYPSFNQNDDQLIFNSYDPMTNDSLLAVVDLDASKINPTAAPVGLISEAWYGTFYEDGIRAINIGIEDEIAIDAGTLTVYPNPTDGVLNIDYELKENADIQIDVLDIVGKVVNAGLPQQTRFAGTHSHELELSSLPAGAYFIRFRINDEMKTLKVLKQ